MESKLAGEGSENRRVTNAGSKNSRPEPDGPDKLGWNGETLWSESEWKVGQIWSWKRYDWVEGWSCLTQNFGNEVMEPYKRWECQVCPHAREHWFAEMRVNIREYGNKVMSDNLVVFTTFDFMELKISNICSCQVRTFSRTQPIITIIRFKKKMF